MPQKCIQAAPGGSNSPKVTNTPNAVNELALKPTPVITTITDASRYVGIGEDIAPECLGAFSINPAATVELLLSASVARVNRVRSLLVPYAFGGAAALDAVSPDDLRQFFVTLVDMHAEAIQMLEHITAEVGKMAEARDE